MRKYIPWILVVCLSFGWLIDRFSSRIIAESANVTIKKIENSNTQKKDWEAFEVADLIKKREKSGRSYLPFMRYPTLSMGLYSLPKGANDRQPAHDEDEVYYIESGEAVLQIGNENQPIKKGSIVYVKREIPHKFHSITKDLNVLVFFSAEKPEKKK